MVMNPDLLLCRMDPSTNLNIELTIENGRGYVPAEDNKNKEGALGTIAIDSIHTPIKNVKYAIENTRVEQKTDYEKLILDVTTDGTIHPEEAVKDAAKILIQHLMLISDEKITFDDFSESAHEVVDDHVLHMRKLLKTPLEDLDLSVRAYNCLKTAKINNLSELVKFDLNDLLKFRNFGKKSLTEIEAMVHEKGLHFGMDLSKYKLED
jgi:DNA-directed RNA polymerase subunit alpha